MLPEWELVAFWRAMPRRPRLVSITACTLALACASTPAPLTPITTRVEPVAASEPDQPSPAPSPSSEEASARDTSETPLSSAWREAGRDCAALPADLQGACFDAELGRQGGALFDDIADNFRALELLDGVGRAECASERDLGAREACALEAQEQALAELATVCDREPEDQRHRCLMQKLIEKYGP